MNQWNKSNKGETRKYRCEQKFIGEKKEKNWMIKESDKKILPM